MVSPLGFLLSFLFLLVTRPYFARADTFLFGISGLMGVGSFVLSWETVCATFDAIYLNWDPSFFREARSVHS